jgi:hypothetical protein
MVVRDAVCREPVSAVIFPSTWESSGKNALTRPNPTICPIALQQLRGFRAVFLYPMFVGRPHRVRGNAM